MNDKKICFITCVNDDNQYAKCLVYINNLNVPEGYGIDTISIKEAHCMASGYNEAISNTDAKYKVYLHQDTYILNNNFIYDILRIFNKDKNIGMIGVAGAKTIPANGIWWESNQRYGKVYERHTNKVELLAFNDAAAEYVDVKAIDGLIMITQYDIRWREEIFDGWDFYDVSQSIEFSIAGYKTVIPKQQENIWCIHDCGQFNLSNKYDIYRIKFVEQYKEELDELKDYYKVLNNYEFQNCVVKTKEDTNKLINTNYPYKSLGGVNFKISIIISTYNNLKYSKLCIDSIRRYTENDTYEIIVVDNNSTDGTQDWLKEQKYIKTIFNNENLGFVKGCNQGIKLSRKNNDILLLNNDTIVTPNWLKNLIKALYSSKNVGAVGAVTNSCSNHQTIDFNYSNSTELFNFAEKNNIADPSKWEERLRLVGFCMLMKREVVEKIGLLDERFTPGNFEDDDYSYRIRQAGYKLVLCKDSFIHHFGSASFSKDPSLYNNLLNINRKKFEDKWGFDPNYSSLTRYEILNLIDDPNDKNINVLEIGCACGATLLEIKNRYKNCDLYGIELNERAANIAKSFAKVQCANIENVTLDLNENYYDYIIFADVLEHLYDPYRVLTNMKKYLKKNGKILASIPNIMHYSVLKNLINGNWHYEDAGILDRTHIRFFTLSEIDSMFAKSGYENMAYWANVLLNTESDQDFIDALSALSNNSVKKQFTVYQYIIKASKKLNNSDS